jgi:hypothetical protein
MPKLQTIRKIDELEYEWEDKKFKRLIIYRNFKRYRKIIKKLCWLYQLPLIKIMRTNLDLNYFNRDKYILYLVRNACVIDLLHELAHYIQRMRRYPNHPKYEQKGKENYHGTDFRNLIKEVIQVYRTNHI